jgi:hypothetical protein
LLEFRDGIVHRNFLAFLAAKKCINIEAGQGLDGIFAPFGLGFRRNWKG